VTDIRSSSLAASGAAICDETAARCCGFCARPLGEQYGPGRVRLYCRGACRQAAYRKRNPGWRSRQDPFGAWLKDVILGQATTAPPAG
jgi:hypothetical protein